ncbi:phage portal protein [Acholeplasma vituli]|uniref:Phage portal protein n=1 Tax=Paracholeplasma vituli TaxID=69473 RepID=A0ABT2PUC9_9MOLU|nr:phage portal protein [Paracholeplasma vituli]MCU0104435.1 phage portal protein [Paracholeplasma vituli]
MSIFDVFKKKKTIDSSNEFNIFSANLNYMMSNSKRIEDSDIAEICIDRIASHISKLKPKHIKHGKEGSVEVIEDEINFRLSHYPNELMTTSEFIYKVVSLLLTNNNCFIYLSFNQKNQLTGLYPLNPVKVEIKQDLGETLFLDMDFGDGKTYTLPYESLIHLKRLYKNHELFGGDGAISNHKQLLKSINMNENLLTGLENALRSSFQVKGLLKMNAMLSEKDKQKQKDIFDEALKTNRDKNGSSIIPVDMKADYIPLSIDPKIIDKETLTFVQNKILNYFGVSESILNSKYDENEYNAFYENTLEPISIFLSNAFSKALLTDKSLTEGEQVMFYGERLNYASWSSKITAIEKLMGLGIFSINESRGVLGYPPIEEGNKRIQSLNFVNAKYADQYQVGKDDKDDK